MARLNTAIDIANVDRSADQPFELLPDGDYLLEIMAIEAREDGNNQAHSYTYSVIEPEDQKGRRIYDWIDLQNDLEWKQNKGQARLGNLCDSIGYDPATEGILEDDDVLMFRAFMAKVERQPGGVSKAGKEFKPKNVVARFYKPTDKDAPEQASIYPNQPPLPEPKAAPKPANDNRPASGDARTTGNGGAAASTGGKSRPWGKRAA